MSLFDTLDDIDDPFIKEGGYLFALRKIAEEKSKGGHTLFVVEFDVEKVFDDKPGREITDPNGEIIEVKASNPQGSVARYQVNMTKNPMLAKKEVTTFFEVLQRCLPVDLRPGETGNGKTLPQTIKEDWIGDNLEGLLFKCDCRYNDEKIAEGKRPFPRKTFRAVAPEDQPALKEEDED